MEPQSRRIDKVADDVTMQAYIDNATPTAAENAVAIKLLIEHGGWRMGP